MEIHGATISAICHSSFFGHSCIARDHHHSAVWGSDANAARGAGDIVLSTQNESKHD